MHDAKSFDSLSGAVLLLGLAQGVVPFVAKALGWTPVWALPRHLDAPLWWIVSAAVIVIAATALLVIDRAKHRAPGAYS